MGSPAKRRKTNKTTAVPVRQIDAFFRKPTITEPVAAANAGAEVGDGALPLSPGLSDEEYARQLQAQWEEEEKVLSQKSGIDERSDQVAESGVALKGGEISTAFKEIDDSSHEPTEALVDPSTVPSDPASPRDQAPDPPPQPSKSFLSLQSAGSIEDRITSSIPFDEDWLTFSASSHLPALKAQWQANGGGDSTYALLIRCFTLVNSTTKRLKILSTMVNCFRTIIEGDPESLLPAVWLSTNSISPPYIDLELGLGGSAISNALLKVYGLSRDSLKALSDKYGDAGDVAFEAKARQSFTLRKPKPLTVKIVYDILVKIANSKGTGSRESKSRLVERLMRDARGGEESRYIGRTLVQHLRIGAVKTTMLTVLSRAFMLSRPSGATWPIKTQDELRAMSKEASVELLQGQADIVRSSFARHPNYNDLIPALLEVGVCDELLARVGLALHIPLKPMLGNITRDLGDMLTKLQGSAFTCEYKYDGQRAQIHCDAGGKVSIFSRHLEVMTSKYPDLVAIVPKIRGEGVSSFILEGEVVAVGQEGGLKTFQTLTNRAKKDVAIHEVQVNVCLFAFDLMFLNGEDLLSRSLRERRGLLKGMFHEIPGQFTWVKNMDFDGGTADSEAVLEFFRGATEGKCEGIMVKVLDSQQEALEPSTSGITSAPPTPSKPKPKSKAKKALPPIAFDPTEPSTPALQPLKPPTRRKPLLSTYMPDLRLDSWLKVKKDYSNSASTTLDLIPIGSWHGSGRKCAWWSPILLAVRSPATGRLVAVTKCISGFTDKFYGANKEKYAEGGENVLGRGETGRRNFVEYRGCPDVWFEAREVWEVAFADITRSPVYTAAKELVGGEDGRGLSLRFPRFLRVREDKGIEEATDEEELAGLWWKQEAVGEVKGEGGEKVEKERVEDDDWY